MKKLYTIFPATFALLVPSIAFAQPAPAQSTASEPVAQASPAQPAPKSIVFEKPVAAAAPSVPSKSESNFPPHVDSSWNRSKSSLPEENLWQLKLYGYLRTGYTWQQGETSATTNGFFTANARLGLSGTVYKMFGFNILFDGAGKFLTDSTAVVDKSTGDVTGVSNKVGYGVALKDAFLTFKPYGFLEFHIGQFIPTFALEGFGSTSKRPFASLSMGGNKYAKGGREGGISVGAYNYKPFDDASGLKDLGFTYELAITNGSAGISKTYDFGYYLRAGASWGSLINFGVGYYYNPKPAIDGSMQGIAVDATSSFFNTTLIASYIHQISTLTKTFHTPSDAFQISAQYALPYGFIPGIRYEFMDPDSSSLGKDDMSQAVTFGLNWEMKNLPIKLVANYTLNMEQGPKKKNDKFEFIAQAKY